MYLGYGQALSPQTAFLKIVQSDDADIPTTIAHLGFAICDLRLRLAICYLLSAICYWLSAIGYLLLAGSVKTSVTLVGQDIGNTF
jgi:hypothetical protein